MATAAEPVPVFSFTFTGTWQKIDIPLAATGLVPDPPSMQVAMWANDEEFKKYEKWANTATNKPTNLQF